MTDQKLYKLEQRLQDNKDLLEVNPNLAFNKYNQEVLRTYPEKIRKRKQELKDKLADVKDFNTFTSIDVDEFRLFVKWLVDLKINFHPEDDFNDYTNEEGTKTFTKDIANIINENFIIARSELSEEDFWKICFEVTRTEKGKR